MKRAVLLCLLLTTGSAAAQTIQTWKGESAEAKPGARASLTVDGPWLPVAAAKPTSLEIHDAKTARPRFLERADGAKLLLYIEPTQLAAFTLPFTVLTPTSDGLRSPVHAKTPGMRLSAGVRLEEVGADEDGHTRVKIAWTWDGGSFVVRGWVMTAKVATIYNSVYEEPPAFEPDVTAPGTFELLDKPGGKPFVFSKREDRVELMTLERKGKFSLVRTGQGAVGWIATKHTKKLQLEATMYGLGGGGSGIGVSGDTTLPAHTPLYDAVDGNWIGETESWFAVAPAERAGDWLRFDLKTRFGVVAAWAKQPKQPRP